MPKKYPKNKAPVLVKPVPTKQGVKQNKKEKKSMKMKKR